MEYGIYFNYCKACIYEIMYIINICVIMYFNNYTIVYNTSVKLRCQIVSLSKLNTN